MQNINSIREKSFEIYIPLLCKRVYGWGLWGKIKSFLSIIKIKILLHVRKYCLQQTDSYGMFL